LSQATTTGESIAGKIRSRAVVIVISNIHGESMPTYIWFWLSCPSVAAVLSLYLDVLCDPASVLSDHWKLDPGFCNGDRTGTVDYAAVRHSAGQLVGRSFVETGDMYLPRTDQGPYGGHTADPPVGNNPTLHSPAPAAGSHSHNIVLPHSTTRSDWVVLGIDLEIVAPARADCADCKPWYTVNCRREDSMV
jgi:hypothetical protein